MKLSSPLLAICLLALVQYGAAFADPFITDFTPTAGTPGDKVMIFGTGFTTSGGIVIRFWSGQAATQGVITSDSQLTVTVPAGISSGPISIQGNGGAENFTANDFTAVGLGPYITDLSPPYGKTNDLVVISGVHFTGLTKAGVSFNGWAAADAGVNSDGTQINVHVPFGATSGAVTVTTPLGSSNAPVAFAVLGPGPFISGFSPQVGTAATTVFIDGVHFTGATNATFNGKPGVNFAAQSDTIIRVDAPAGVTSGPLAVNTPLGSFTTSSNFFVPPSVASFSPAAGRQGTNVVIIGVNLRGATAVSFNGKAATYTVVNNTNISATVPAGATTGTLRVTAPAGSAFSASNFVVRPVITGFAPTFGPAGTSVVISGANLNVGTPVVRFNGVAAAAPTQVGFGQLTATVPTTTTGPISITTSDGSYTNAELFYLPALFISFSSTNGAPGTRVTITGQNFTDASAVSFNGTPAPDFSVTDNNTLAVTVPAGFTTGPITVTTPAGAATSTRLFYAAPIISSFSPTHGLPGTNVTVNGSSFLGATSVKFNGISAQFVVVNNSQIAAIVPASGLSGPITVIAPGGTNTSSQNFVLDYFTDLGVSITSSPNPVVVGSNLLYTIKVMNNGPLAAPNLRLTNMLPDSVTLRSLAAPTGWFFSTNGNPLEGGISSLAANASATILVTVAPQAPGTITNSAALGSDYSDPGASNNLATSTTTVLPLALLSIHRVPGQLLVSWPSTLTNYVLESRERLTSDSSWSSVTSTPAMSGGVKVVTVTNSGPANYYRLRK